MVNSWSPDPPQNHCNSEVEPINSSSLTTFAESSSDSEVEDGTNDGYELLPMTPNEEVECDSDSEEEVNDTARQGNTEICNHEDNQERSIHSECIAEHNVPRNTEMDPELMEQVKKAMSGFTLPLTAVPSWAFHVPEQEWRSVLFERMQGIQKGAQNDASSTRKDSN